MASTLKTRSRLLFAVVSVIGILLAINAFLIYQNSLSIERNQLLLKNAEQAKLNSLDIIRNIHLMDLALRGYALTGQEPQLAATDSAKISHPKIIKRLREALQAQHFERLAELDSLELTVTAYFNHCDRMLLLVKDKKMDEFLTLLRANEGYEVWRAYKTFSDRVTIFETKVVADANTNIQRALRSSYLLQFLIFLLAVPALGYMAFSTAKTFLLSDELRKAQQEKNKILQQNNEELDRQVKEKTKDLFEQNESIKAHNEQLIIQQQQIKLANETIETQAFQIEQKNKELAQEVERQTNDLLIANRELGEQNTRLQQFTYIISHNLRAPMVRLIGLANLLEYSEAAADKDDIYKMVVKSCRDIDEVIRDLSDILYVQRQNTLTRSEVDLSQMVHKVLVTLQDEISVVKATVDLRMGNEKILSVAPYVESILYNLISNAIKYRDPDRLLKLEIVSFITNSFVCVEITDNGLGIDMTMHRDNLFNLYKRFHQHVEGKGLGLYLVKTQMEALGGRIEVESEVNKGTRFVLYFNIG
jgi:signal transduction histidine kinase